MAHWCESCGQELPAGETASDATWLGTSPSHQHTFAKPGSPKPSGRDRKLLLAVVGAVAIWGLFVGLGRVVTPDDTIDEQAAASIEEARIEQQAQVEEAERQRDDAAEEARAEAAAAAIAESVEIAEVAGGYGAADASPGLRVVTGSAAVGSASGQIQRLQRQLSRRESTVFVAYRSDEGVVIVDLVGGGSVVWDVAPGVTSSYGQSQLLRSGTATFAIDSETLTVRRIAENSSVVVTETLDGNTYIVENGPPGPGALVEVIADGQYGFYRFPEGALQSKPLDGLGLLAVPIDTMGETLIASQDRFITLSDNRVVTGTSSTLLEQLCASVEQCSLVLTDRESGDQHAVPASFVRNDDQYVVAPDGQALLRHSPEGFAEVYVVATETIRWVTGTGMRKPVWSPDSDFIAWIDRVGDPTLRIMFPDDRDWIRIDVRDFGAPPPASSDLIVFASDLSLAADLPAES